MLPEMELFQYIYKTADMGCQGIDTVEEHAEKRLREELRRERQEYRAIRDEADGYIRQRGDTPRAWGHGARIRRMDEQGPAGHGRFAAERSRK